jgi:hypothetical protein
MQLVSYFCSIFVIYIQGLESASFIQTQFDKCELNFVLSFIKNFKIYGRALGTFEESETRICSILSDNTLIV